MNRPERIFLTGFMAAGKSTIGKILANTMGYQFVDTDKVIVERTGLSIPEYFRQFGEAKFREYERDILHELGNLQNNIISVGGGTLCFFDNVSFAKQKGLLIYLKVSKKTLFYRIRARKDRPAFLDKAGNLLPDHEIFLKIDELFNQRLKYYEQADIIFSTHRLPLGVVVDRLKWMIENEETVN